MAKANGTGPVLPVALTETEAVEMFERTHFDPLHSRWIDEWVPTAAPQQALAQTIRCYSPPDLLLLLEGTGLQLAALEVDAVLIGEALVAASDPGARLRALKEAGR